jgi:hypothetical protein
LIFQGNRVEGNILILVKGDHHMGSQVDRVGDKD